MAFIEQRLVVPRRPVQRIQRDAAVDPASGVAGVQRVRQRWHQVLTATQSLASHARGGGSGCCRQVVGCEASDQEPGEGPGIQAVQVSPRVLDETGTDLIGVILRSKSQDLASGIAIVSVSTLCSSTTSTPRSRILDMKSK